MTRFTVVFWNVHQFDSTFDCMDEMVFMADSEADAVARFRSEMGEDHSVQCVVVG